MQQGAPKPPSELQYQRQDSPLTLEQGLAEYYAANLGRVTRPADLPPESAALFRSHDMCHVIFGLSTTLADETLADARTLFSCDVGWRRYARYLKTDAQAKALFAELGWLKGMGITLACLPRIARAGLEALRVTKPWPWEPPEGYGRRTLAELRREHGIRVI